MARCSSCGTTNQEGVRFCKSCGQSAFNPIPATNFCGLCSAELTSTAKFCKQCGNAATADAPQDAISPEIISETLQQTQGASNDLQPSEIKPMQCEQCATLLVAGAKFCKRCGALQAVSAEPSIELTVSHTTSESASAENASEIVAPDQKDLLSIPTHTATPTAASQASMVKESVSMSEALPAWNVMRANDGGLKEESTTGKKSAIVGGILLSFLLIVGGGFWLMQKTSPAPTEKTSAQPDISSVSKHVDAITASASGTSVTPPNTSLSKADENPVTESAVAAAKEPPVLSKPALVKPEQTPTQTSPKSNQSVRPITVAQGIQQDHIPATRLQNRRNEPIARDTSDAVINSKVVSLLARAENYIEIKQYDKAIATAESALELAPDNAAAQAKIKQARNKQFEALKYGSSIN